MSSMMRCSHFSYSVFEISRPAKNLYTVFKALHHSQSGLEIPLNYGKQSGRNLDGAIKGQIVR